MHLLQSWIPAQESSCSSTYSCKVHCILHGLKAPFPFSGILCSATETLSSLEICSFEQTTWQILYFEKVWLSTQRRTVVLWYGQQQYQHMELTWNQELEVFKSQLKLKLWLQWLLNMKIQEKYQTW